MPLGSAPTSIIDIDYTRAQGVGSKGQIHFEPKRMTIGSTVLSNFAVVVDIVDGVGSIELVRLPFGTYRVREFMDGLNTNEFSFALPVDAPDVIQYETLAHVDFVPATFTVVKSVNGVLPNPITGNVEVSAGGSVPDATTLVKGKLQLAGDLAGTAAAPTVPALAEKYVKPGSGIPLTDFSVAVQTLLGKANTAVQFDDLAPVATAGAYSSLTGLPTIPNSPDDIGAQPAGDYATNGSLAPVATAGTYASLTGRPVTTAARPVFPLSNYSAGWHSASVNIDDCNNNGGIAEVWQMRVTVPAGEPVNQVGSFLKSAGVVGGGGENGFAIYSDDGAIEHFRIDDDSLWSIVGPTNALLGGSSIAPQATDVTYRVHMNVRGWSSSPDFLFVALSSALSEAGSKRCRYGLTAFPSAGFDPTTLGFATGGYIPFVTLGR